MWLAWSPGLLVAIAMGTVTRWARCWIPVLPIRISSFQTVHTAQYRLCQKYFSMARIFRPAARGTSFDESGFIEA